MQQQSCSVLDVTRYISSLQNDQYKKDVPEKRRSAWSRAVSCGLPVVQPCMCAVWRVQPDVSLSAGHQNLSRSDAHLVPAQLVLEAGDVCLRGCRARVGNVHLGEGARGCAPRPAPRKAVPARARAARAGAPAPPAGAWPARPAPPAGPPLPPRLVCWPCKQVCAQVCQGGLCGMQVLAGPARMAGATLSVRLLPGHLCKIGLP